MNRLIFIFVIILSCSAICYGGSGINFIYPNEGTTLIYQHQLEAQYLPGETYDKYIEVYDKSIGDKVKVGIKTWERTEKVVSKDDGLKYGFPLKVGMKWDEECNFERDDNMYCKYVEKIEDVIVPAGTFKGCFKIVHKTCPDEEAEWYCPGVGIVKYEYRHHGTITNERYELKEI